MVVLSRNGLLDGDAVRSLKTCRFLQEGRELAEGKRPATQDWCKLLLSDPERERRFRNLHRILQARAQQILDAARAASRRPADADGQRAEPAAARITGELSRARTAAPGLRVHAHRGGNQLRQGRALRAAPQGTLCAAGPGLVAEDDPTAFFACGRQHPPLPGRRDARETAFDTWFQRAASETKLPMTFHRWRHGYATLLLAEYWNNLPVAADMLGNTPTVCAKSYAWIKKEDLYPAGQDIMIERSKGR
jgi:hypothetical protein